MKSGVNMFPLQKSGTNGTELWDVKLPPQEKYPDWNISHEKVNENGYDSALVLNITHNAYADAVAFIKENNLSIGHIINCTLDEVGATNFSIRNGTHAACLADSIYKAVVKRSTAERRETLHIFASAPNAFIFFLGKNSLGFGKCVLYEYDYEHKGSCSYTRSIEFTN